MNRRINQILEYLTDHEKAEVNTLSALLNVSQVTIRKDLTELEKDGIIIREHGSARLRSPDDINSRIAYHYESKLKIAEKAAELISSGDTLMIESGSCCALLAETLAREKNDLTVITNSAFICEKISANPSCQAILLGGTFQPDSRVTVGPLVRSSAMNYFVDCFFIGTDGYSRQTGFTNKDQMRMQAVRDMAPQAEQIIILTESEKFSKRGVVPMNIPSQPRVVITDRNVPPETADELKEKNIKVIQV